MKSKIPTPDQMTKLDKESKIQKAIAEKKRVVIEKKNIIGIEHEDESSSSSSLMSMCNLDSNKEDS